MSFEVKIISLLTLQFPALQKTVGAIKRLEKIGNSVSERIFLKITITLSFADRASITWFQISVT